MKIWEVVKALTVNPEAQFKNQRFGGIIGYNEFGSLAWISGTKRDGEAFTLSCIQNVPEWCQGNWDDDWELVQEPVDFMTAVKAYAEGKTIRCEYNNRTLNFSDDCKHWDGFRFAPNELGYIGTESILHGKWYIEE
jgi:hypothetical protein